jgi:hypothetical protein
MTASGPGSVLDEGIIADMRDLKTASGEPLLEKILRLFSSNAPLVMKDLLAHRMMDQAHELADGAHALKSLCFNVGAMDAARECDRLEIAARTGSAFDVESHLEALSRELHLALSEVRRLQD